MHQKFRLQKPNFCLYCYKKVFGSGSQGFTESQNQAVIRTAKVFGIKYACKYVRLPKTILLVKVFMTERF